MSDADVAAYEYSDDPGNFRDEYAIWFMTTEDLDSSWPDWPPYHKTYGRSYAFQTDQYKAYVFEDHIINAINGDTSQSEAADDLGHHADEILRFEISSLHLNMFDALHAYQDQAQCSTHAAVLTSLLRGAGIPARPVVVDWDMIVRPISLFDHSTELWLNGLWLVMRAFKSNESPPPTPIARGIYPPDDRSQWFYFDSNGDIIVVANSNWVWEQTQTGGSASGQTDYEFGNYDNTSIIRWDWIKTQVNPYGWAWPGEPRDVGDPYRDWLSWPCCTPTPTSTATQGQVPVPSYLSKEIPELYRPPIPLHLQ
jgi:hypothetical protein